MEFSNKIMLISYADCMGNNLDNLGYVLDKYYSGAIGGLHILPFYPSTADRGFSPVCYDRVETAFGTWNDIARLSNKFYLMFDFMINHISSHSRFFQDFLLKKDQSAYRDMFIRYRDFWPGGEPAPEDFRRIYKRKPNPWVTVTFPDGSREKIWSTFSDDQIDLNIRSKATRNYIRDTVTSLLKHGASIIRLDAFAYAVKKAGTNCFFVEPEIWDLLYAVQALINPDTQLILPEIHEHYSIQLKLAKKGFWVYDFALPMLVLHALYMRNARPLKHWLQICPRKQFTTLDTHDGIGVVDVKDLLSNEEIEQTKQCIFEKGANVKREYNMRAYHNLDIYQINCTYYSALGNNDRAYLLARAIQFFAPGIPQVYYVGMLAGENDIALMEKTKQGRDINRHYYTVDEVGRNLERPVVWNLRELMRFRNRCPAFHGSCVVEDTPDNQLRILRESGGSRAVLDADFSTMEFEIHYRNTAGEKYKSLTFENL